MNEIPAPRFLAPYSHGISATVGARGHDSTEAHLVLLHDPQGQPSWEGVFRLVTYVGTATAEPWQTAGHWQTQMWRNLIDALRTCRAPYRAAGGTVTCTSSRSCGELAAPEPAGDGRVRPSITHNGNNNGLQIQLRASWTPSGSEVRRHLDAWESLIIAAATISGPRYQ